MKNKLLVFVTILLSLNLVGCGKTKKENIPEKEKISQYFVYGADTVVHYDGSKWEHLEPNDVQWKEFDVFDGDSYMGYYSLQFNKKWYVFDEDRLSQKYQEQIFAYSGEAEINLFRKYEDYSNDDIVELSDLLMAENIVNYGTLTYAKKMKLSESLTIYIATNIYSEKEKDSVFSIVYLKNGNEIKLLDHFYGSNEEELLMPSYYFEKIFDLSDNKYKILLLKTYFGNSSNDCHILYEINDQKEEKILDCKKIYKEEEKFVASNKNEEKKSKFNLLYVIAPIGIVLVILMAYILIKNRRENKI